MQYFLCTFVSFSRTFFSGRNLTHKKAARQSTSCFFVLISLNCKNVREKSTNVYKKYCILFRNVIFYSCCRPQRAHNYLWRVSKLIKSAEGVPQIDVSVNLSGKRTEHRNSGDRQLSEVMQCSTLPES